MQSTELERLLAVLRRFEAEAAREEARIFSTSLKPRRAMQARSKLMLSEPPLLLTDDGDSEARAQAPAPYTIDMDALESELAAA